MKTLVFLLAVVALATAAFEFTEEWEIWKKVCYPKIFTQSVCSCLVHAKLYSIFTKTQGKSYASDREELQRRIIWEANKRYVDNHNEFADEFGFTLAMNEFADLVCNFR